MVTIKTKDFVLRPFRQSDKHDLIKNINDKKVSMHMSNINFPYTSRDADKWIKSLRIRSSREHKKKILFAIEMGKKFRGSISLNNIENHRADLGYWLSRSCWNKGIMTKAVKLVSDFGFRKLGLIRIQAHVFEKNKASEKVLRKNRFKLEGCMKKYQLKNDKYHDVLIYAKVI